MNTAGFTWRQSETAAKYFRGPIKIISPIKHKLFHENHYLQFHVQNIWNCIVTWKYSLGPQIFEKLCSIHFRITKKSKIFP